MESKTATNAALLLLRFALGVVILAHGAQKIGLLGGTAMAETVSMMQRDHGIAPALAYLTIAAETLGGLGVVFGLLGRLAAFAIACEQATAIVKFHLGNGIFLVDRGQVAGGIELALLLFATSLSLAFLGMGKFSIDSLIARKMDKSIAAK
jgi:putative oxidoreductase